MVELKIKSGMEVERIDFNTKEEFESHIAELKEQKILEEIEYLVDELDYTEEEAREEAEDKYSDCEENAELLFGEGYSMEVIEYIMLVDLLEKNNIKFETSLSGSIYLNNGDLRISNHKRPAIVDGYNATEHNYNKEFIYNDGVVDNETELNELLGIDLSKVYAEIRV